MSKNLALLLPDLTDDELSWVEFAISYRDVDGSALTRANYVLVDAAKVLARLNTTVGIRWKPARDSLKQKLLKHLSEEGVS